jgi:hypothetical protein
VRFVGGRARHCLEMHAIRLRRPSAATDL